MRTPDLPSQTSLILKFWTVAGKSLPTLQSSGDFGLLQGVNAHVASDGNSQGTHYLGSSFVTNHISCHLLRTYSVVSDFRNIILSVTTVMQSWQNYPISQVRNMRLKSVYITCLPSVPQWESKRTCAHPRLRDRTILFLLLMISHTIVSALNCFLTPSIY
jgi:hypothetical protein